MAWSVYKWPYSGANQQIDHYIDYKKELIDYILNLDLSQSVDLKHITSSLPRQISRPNDFKEFIKLEAEIIVRSAYEENKNNLENYKTLEIMDIERRRDDLTLILKLPKNESFPPKSDLFLIKTTNNNVVLARSEESSPTDLRLKISIKNNKDLSSLFIHGEKTSITQINSTRNQERMYDAVSIPLNIPFEEEYLNRIPEIKSNQHALSQNVD